MELTIKELADELSVSKTAIRKHMDDKFRDTYTIKKGNKILIFDDLERSEVKLETLLGYINYFSEHCKCKVIIIGDENKISEKEDDKCKLKFKDFKEKTIGRTFEIKVNIEETLDFFIGEISANNRNLLSENKELIIKIFTKKSFVNFKIIV